MTPARQALIVARQLRAHLLHFFAKPREHLHVALAALDFLVENHTIETLAAFDQFRRQFKMRRRDESEAIDVSRDHLFGFLDALGDFHFLLPRQQRHLAHLLQIHPHRIVEDVELRLRFFLVLLGILFDVLVTIHLRRLDDVDLEFAQAH